MNNLIKEVGKHFDLLTSTRKGVFFVKDGDHWTAEPGLSKRKREKMEGIHVKAGELKNYQTQIGMALYIESKYYGDCNIEDPDRILAQFSCMESLDR